MGGGVGWGGDFVDYTQFLGVIGPFSPPHHPSGYNTECRIKESTDTENASVIFADIKE